MCGNNTKKISLCSYPYFKLTKHHAFLSIFYVFSSTKSKNKREEEVLLGGGGRGRWPK
jgi:hypothetical protein